MQRLTRRQFARQSAAAGLTLLAMSKQVACARGDSDDLHHALAEAVRSTGNPGAVAYVGDRKKTYFHEAFGYRQTTPRKLTAEKDTVYDLASVTKVLATTPAILKLHETGKLDLDAPVSTFTPFPGFKRFTVRHCLTHGTGLPPGRPFYRDVITLEEMVHQIALLPLSFTPGTRRRYSDLGFVLLGDIVEKVAGEPLDVYCAKHFYTPLGMKDTGFNPPKKRRERGAATELCRWRKRVMVGQVHDENTFAIGGVAGSAGLFSTAGDMAIFCRALLRGKVLRPKTVDLMTAMTTVPAYPWQGLGWWLDPWEESASGYLPARNVFGHAGWTGTSVWIDRDTGLFCILLGNTCHPSRRSRKNEDFRRTFHTGVARRFYPGRGNVHTGLDRVLRTAFRPMRGKRIALLTNHAAVDQLGRHILDVFALEDDVTLSMIFSPEHGLRGLAEAGARVSDEKGGKVPVISLYGKRKTPDREHLRGLDYFVVDLQDIGARYYTYMSTMKDCLAACAAAGTPVIILDRPNPLGGTVIEGTLPTDFGPSVCCAPIPNRHGMTLGELALFFKAGDASLKKLRLSIHELDGWSPEWLFPACALPWVPPSPNIPTPETALAYAGTCLFEGVNLNEGRGTETPFLVFGAPWLKPRDVLERIPQDRHPGVRLETVRYTPRSIPGKSATPRYRDTACRGIRLHIRDSGRFRPFALTVALLVAIHDRHGDELTFSPFFDTLAGGATLRQAILDGRTAEAILREAEAGLARFDRQRPRRYAKKTGMRSRLS